jgi:hypothetical protein
MLCFGVMRCVWTIRMHGIVADLEQIEYLVVNYKAEDEKVTLSLRQADILHALAHDEELCTSGGCVPDLQDVGYVKRLGTILIANIL